MNVIRNPHTPYIGVIPGGCRVGTQVVIDGHVPHWFVERFDINLICGFNPTHTQHADIALHFNPRFDGEHAVILNDRRGNNWGSEQRLHNHHHIQKGYDFELQITVEESYFRITVNGQHFANFPHRQSYHEIGLLHIAGQVDIRRIQFNQLGGGGGYQPGPVYVPGGQPVYAAPTAPPSYSSGYTPAPVMQPAMQPVMQPVFPQPYTPAVVMPTYPGQVVYQPGHAHHQRHHHHDHHHHRRHF